MLSTLHPPSQQPPRISNTTRPLKFVVVGGVGFIVDATVLTLLTSLWHWQPMSARLVSFVVAASTTWWLNRRYAFADRRASTARTTSSEYTRYLLTQSLGALVNLSVFALAIWSWPALHSYPVVPLAMGSACALMCNYYIMHRFVFRSGPHKDREPGRSLDQGMQRKAKPGKKTQRTHST